LAERTAAKKGSSSMWRGTKGGKPSRRSATGKRWTDAGGSLSILVLIRRKKRKKLKGGGAAKDGLARIAKVREKNAKLRSRKTDEGLKEARTGELA